MFLASISIFLGLAQVWNWMKLQNGHGLPWISMNWIASYQISHLWWWPNHPKLAFENPPKCLWVMDLERSLLLEWKAWQNGLHLKCQTPFLLVLDIWCVIGLVSNWPAKCSMSSPWNRHFFSHDLWSLNGASIQCGAPVRQLSWFISPITMIYYTYNYS